MRAIVYTQIGPPEGLRLEDIPEPAMRDREVLVKVVATTVTIGDTIMRSLNLPGEIESSDRMVTRFNPGDLALDSMFAIILV